LFPIVASASVLHAGRQDDASDETVPVVRDDPKIALVVLDDAARVTEA